MTRTCRDVAVAASCAALALGPAAAEAQQPTAPGAGYAAVHGVVYDSLTRGPLAGATVQVVRASDLLGHRTVAADSAGAFRIDSLAPGRYLVGFDHQLLDLLRAGVQPRLVELGPGGDAVRVDLSVPSLAGVRPALCGSAADPSDSTGLLAGRVRDAAGDTPVDRATVVLAWVELSMGAGGVRTERRRVPFPTGPGGTYLACGVPAGVEVTVSVAAPGRAGGPIELELPPRGFVVRDFALGDSATVAAEVSAPAPRARSSSPRGRPATPAPLARGTARLTGTVRDPAGRPVRGARASVWGAAEEGTTGEDGTFTLGGLPAGTRTLEVRAIGFAPRRVAVDLAPGRAGTVDVWLERGVASLAPVNVLGTATPRSVHLAEFLSRRQNSASGRFVTAEDLERWTMPEASTAVGVLGGLRVDRGPRGNLIIGRGPDGPCLAQVFVDGIELPPGDMVDNLVRPHQLAGIEVYPDKPMAPPQYSTARLNKCSVVLFWTRP